jgi:hypothetical protein
MKYLVEIIGYLFLAAIFLLAFILARDVYRMEKEKERQLYTVIQMQGDSVITEWKHVKNIYQNGDIIEFDLPDGTVTRLVNESYQLKKEK